MIHQTKLHALKKAVGKFTPTDQLVHSLIDSNLEAWEQLEGGKDTQTQRAELKERERQVGIALAQLREVIHPLLDAGPDPDPASKALYIVDQIMDMLRARGPKWKREWSWYAPLIEEEFGA